jgi:NADH-quinone oxidoreductase subunit H
MIELILIIFISFFLGLFYSFLIRKFSARLQWRIGPLVFMYKDLRSIMGITRIIQPLYDIIKLFGKKTIIPESSRKRLFTYSPYISLIFAFISIFFIPFSGISLLSNVPYSLVIVSYLLIGSLLFMIIGPIASGSPWAFIGVRREAELFLVAEFGFIISLFSMAISKNSLILWEISISEFNLVNITAGLLMFTSILGKLHIKPFDMSEAEAEIVAGPYTEYSGKLLGIYYLTKIFLIYDFIALFISIFIPINILPIYLSIPLFLIISILIIFILSIIHVLNPRYRIKNALIWYIKIISILCLINIITMVI